MTPPQQMSRSAEPRPANQTGQYTQREPRQRHGKRRRALLLTTIPEQQSRINIALEHGIDLVDRVPLPAAAATLAEHRARKIDLLVVPLSRHAARELRDPILDLYKLGLEVRIVPWTPPLGEAPSESECYDAPVSPDSAAIKRLFDLILCLPLLLVALPVMAAIMLIIKRDSAGPAVFRQWRIGQHGKPFLMYKFRTMYHQTEQAEAGIGTEKPIDPTAEREFKLPYDPRITRVGRFLRRSSLDELPQLINVVRGQMSLVGPRPELRLIVSRYDTWQLARLAVPPGMTGWWQVNGRSNRPTALQMADDLYYLQNCSLRTDLIILFRTVLPVLRGTGAY